MVGMPFGISSADMLYWSLLFILLILALIAIVFSILAWSDSRSTQPHRDLTRQDVKARCDLCVDGDSTFGGAVQMDEGLAVCGPARLRQVCVESLCFGQVQTINVAGTFQLNAKQSSYRVDTAGANDITLLLPAVSQAPGHVFYLMVSVAGAGNTVMLDIADGDVLCNGTCVGTNPAYSFPTTAGNADAVLVTNDSVSAWFVSGHV
jgi:hypothetical protein